MSYNVMAFLYTFINNIDMIFHRLTHTKLPKKIEHLPSCDTRAQVAAGTLHVTFATPDRWPMLAMVSLTRASPYRREQVGSGSSRGVLISLVKTKVRGTY